MSNNLIGLRFSLAFDLCILNVSNTEFPSMDELFDTFWQLSGANIYDLIRIARNNYLPIVSVFKRELEKNDLFLQRLKTKYNTKSHLSHPLIRHQIRVASFRGENSDPSLDMKYLYSLLLSDNDAYRCELLQCKAYFGVIKTTRLHNDVDHIRWVRDDNEGKFFICEHNTWDTGLTIRGYLNCATGNNNDWIIKYDKNVCKWAFYTNYNKHNCQLHLYNVIGTERDLFGDELPSVILRAKARVTYLNYEDNCFSLYNSLNEMITAIERDYLCPCCHELENYPEKKPFRNSCNLEMLDRHKNKIWGLEKMCAFYIQNYFYNKKAIIRQMLPKHLFKYIEDYGGSYIERVSNIDYVNSKMWS